MNVWICAQSTTDRELESVFVGRKVNVRTCAQSTTDRDLETKKRECLDMCTADDHDPALDKKICKVCNVCNFMRTLLFLVLRSSAKIISVFFTYRNGFGIN